MIYIYICVCVVFGPINFRNWACVDLLTWKLIGGWIHWPDMQILFKFLVDHMQIEKQLKNLAYVGLTLWLMLTSKLIGVWIQWPDVLMLFKFQVIRMKFKDFRKFGSNWPMSTKFYETSMQDRRRVGDINLLKSFKISEWSVERFGLDASRHTQIHINKRRRSTYFIKNKKFFLPHNKQTERGKNITSFTYWR